MKIARKHIGQVVEALLTAEAHKATKYVSQTQVISATRILVRGRIPTPRMTRRYAHIVLTIGKPNYAQRQFIKVCNRAGEPLPVNKIQLKFPPKRRR